MSTDQTAGGIRAALDARVLNQSAGGDPYPLRRRLAYQRIQHAAEKFHALTQSYPGGRQNTRVKDLLDIVLMSEAGLLPHPRLADRIGAVFTMRDQAEPPAQLPKPPTSWRIDYRTLALATSARVTELDEAFAIASAIYEATLASRE